MVVLPGTTCTTWTPKMEILAKSWSQTEALNSRHNVVVAAAATAAAAAGAGAGAVGEEEEQE